LNTLQPRAILIDFFGTLVEEIHIPVQAICDQVCRSSDNAVQQLEFNRYWVNLFTRLCESSAGPDFILLKDIEQRSLQATIDHFGLSLDGAELEKKLLEYRAHPLLFAESRRVLAAIGRPLCLLTNIDNSEIRSALNYTGLKFDFVVTSEDCRAYKPRPEVFLKALSLTGCQASEVLHVGDSWQGDVQGAQNLGIPVLWIDRRQKPLPPGARLPDYTAPDLNGLSELLA
jgi:2-haloalkanoic acid dehalogenase type II